MPKEYQTKKPKNSPNGNAKRQQKGSIRKLVRANGTKAWEWRYREAGKMKQKTFSCVDYPTRNELVHHLETRIVVLNGGVAPITQQRGVPMSKVIERYNERELPKLAKSTRDTITSMLQVHFEPRWNDTVAENVFAEDVEDWLQNLSSKDGKLLSGASCTRARNLMKMLLDRAMVWRFLPVGVNPMTLVKTKSPSKKVRPRHTVSIDQINILIAALSHPADLMVLIAASLGLRVEEIIPLEWADFDLERRTVVISRAYTHGELKETKTDASSATLPVEGALFDALIAYKATRTEEQIAGRLLFPSTVTGAYMSASTLLSRKIQPIALELGLPNIGWHSIRHSYKNWQKAGGVTVEFMKDLMRHSQISTTMDIYGDSQVEGLRPHVAAVGNQLRFKASTAVQ